MAHHKHHKETSYHILLCYKNFSNNCLISHIGLGVTAAYCAKTLIHAGYFTQPLPIFGADDLSDFIKAQETSVKPITHVVLMAQFIQIDAIAKMCRRFPHVKFAQNCHSQAGFLQAEPKAIHLLRMAIELETSVANFHAACNNLRLKHALQNSYNRPITYLPNLYYLHGEEPVHRPLYNGGPLRIGCFGSLRIYKNFSTAIVAAIELTNQLKTTSEIWINAGRSDGFGNVVHKTAHEWVKNVPTVTLKELPWASWPEFKHMIGSMNIHLAPSYTETFCNVVADSIAEGVPSVVSPVIEWCPNSWQTDSDDPTQVASTARRLLYDHHAPKDGYHHLKAYVERGLPHWEHFLDRP